jgi:membrane protein DedA with SNARE-associated domain
MASVESWITTYGLFLVALVVGVESVGLPVPGETVLIAASIFAGTKHSLNIVSVIFAAASGAIVGSMIGYVVGREYGYWLLLRYGPYVGITESRIKIGQYLFLRHGGKIVVVARFLPVLRSLVGILAGANRMPWQPYLLANAVGAAIWAALLGLAADDFSKQVAGMAAPMALVLGIVTGIVLIVAGWFVVRYEADLAAEAERALPGPLQMP